MERRNKKPGNNKKTSLFKSDEGSKAGQCVAPRILLKAKEKESEKKVEPTITIATKVGVPKGDPQAPSNDDSRTRNKATQELQPASTVNTMTESVNLISVNNVLNIYAFNHLQDTNSDFFVIGAVGCQFTGKSTVLNLLASKDSTTLHSGVFPTNDIFSRKAHKDLDEEIRMFITTDRIILLDSAPVMSSRGRKDFIIGELDDLKRIILLLSTCHVLLVLLDDNFNINFIRLLLCAEMMIQKDQKNNQYLSPSLVFVKNKSVRRSCSLKEDNSNEIILRQLFKGSKLKVFNCDGNFERLNVLNLPNLIDDSPLSNDSERKACVQKLREHIFMTPRNVADEMQEGFNEKRWSQLVTSVLEEHHNNYFLRKYENLSEKYNLHNHINVAENASKDKNFLSFIDT